MMVLISFKSFLVETSANQNHGRDADFPRMQACRKILGEAKEVFLNNSYVKNKFFLLSLATDPGYHRRGAGSMLCKWGMAKARKEGLTVTLLTSGMGKFLYEKLGFKEGGMAHVQVDGKEEASDKPTMAASIR